VIIIQP